MHLSLKNVFLFNSLLIHVAFVAFLVFLHLSVHFSIILESFWLFILFQHCCTRLVDIIEFPQWWVSKLSWFLSFGCHSQRTSWSYLSHITVILYFQNSLFYYILGLVRSYYWCLCLFSLWWIEILFFDN